MTDYTKVDFFTDASLIDDPIPYYDYLHSLGPVIPVPERNAVFVVGFEEAVTVFRDSKTYSSCNSATGPIPPLPFAPAGDDIGALIDEHRMAMPYAGQVVVMDEPDHAPTRSLLMRLFTPSRLAANARYMQTAGDRLIDEFAVSGQCEVISEYGGPFATLVIADLLGVPEADRGGFREMLSPEVREKMGVLPGQIGVENVQAIAFDFLRDKFSAYVAKRRANPQDDVMTELALATYPDGSAPDPLEAVKLASFLFAAGQDTTARFLGASLRLMCERPEVQDQLRQDLSLLPDFIEEALRLEGSTKTEGRLARVSTELGGVKIPAGTTLVLMISAINRDPRRFEDPNAFRFGRPKIKEHLAFGRGAHTCAGAPLARAETRASLERWLTRFSGIALSEEHHGPAGARHFSYNPSYVVRALRALHLELITV